ncbi:MAG TPA: SAM-dependent methyltransferase [Gammaproteobacteria bacterium]|nr:SAM-dependent methyltransferase [Gammaproteobacteria bacterium]
MIGFALSNKTFCGFQELIFKAAGISLADSKRTLVAGRLAKRVRALNLQDLTAYYRYVSGAEGVRSGELQHCIDFLTTNETYFFRETKHFPFLQETVFCHFARGRPLRLWSAASSSGEEAFTLAMLLADQLGLENPWHILGTDISSRILLSAHQAIYSEHRARGVPKAYWRRYLMRGTDQHQGFVSVVPELREHVSFAPYNLVTSPRKQEKFDVIFCRNVLIYFNEETKLGVVRRLCENLQPKGILVTGHAESLHGMVSSLTSLRPSVYQLN